MSNNLGGILSQSLNDRQARDKDFQATMMLGQYADQQKAEKEQSAIQEQQYYQYINEKAEGLLGYDRERIQEKAMSLQKSIREKIALYGGDQRRFMQNGGHAQLGKYSSDILNSREFTTYQNNKNNLARIMDAESKGLKHLIMQKDIDSMQNYKEAKGGEISYGGMMSEIESPDPNNYDLGSDIPLSDIITHGDNYMKIVGNYAMHYPDLPPPDMEDLKAFASKMGYGSKGSNREAKRFMMDMAKRNASRATNSPKANRAAKEDSRQVDGLSEMTKVIQALPKGMKVEDFYDTEGGTYENKNFFKEEASRNDHVRSFVSNDDWTISARNFNLDETPVIFDYEDNNTWWGNLIKDKFRMANATQILPGYEVPLAESILGKVASEDGTIEFEPTSDMYRMDGVQMTGNEGLRKGTYKGKYTPIGIATGTLTKNGKGQNQLLMSVLNDDDTVDVKQTKKYVDDLKGNEVKSGMFIALQNEEGNVFYKRVEIENPMVRSKISEHVGDAFLLNDEIEASQRQSDEAAVVQRQMKASDEQYKKSAVLIDNVLNDNNSFNLEARDYADPEDPSINRSTLLKSFYSVVSKFGDPTPLADNFTFSKLFSPELLKEIPDLRKVKSKFQSFGTGETDSELIDLWLKAVNKGEEASVISGNTRLAESWKYMLKQYENLN